MATPKIKDRCTELQTFWKKRNDAMAKWYKLIKMVDELKQENMESFVGNDPRSAFNLLVQMLNQEVPHRYPPEVITTDLVEPAGDVSNIITTAWKDIFYRYRLRGRYWMRQFIGLLVATGWYSVFAAMTLDGARCVAEIWNPATVFPVWEDQLIECAHIFNVDKASAKRMAVRNDWNIGSRDPTSNVIIYDHWKLDGVNDINVVNSISFGDITVKDNIIEPKFKRIPIFTGPIGGLPDTGEIITTGEEWKGEIGQGFVATNENIYKYWNKWWTFTLQLLRDTAQARTWEKTRGEKIIKPEEWDKRGAHFRMSPEESIGFMQPPAIPVELRAAQLDMEAMMQRGGPSWSLYGDIRAQISSYVMSQIAASARQLTEPYHRGIQDCMADIDNFWLDLIRSNGYKPYGLSMPAKMPRDVRLVADYEVKIPGDFVQRATAARMLDPQFSLSPHRVMSEFFPEITSQVDEFAKIRAAKAERHPVNAIVSLIVAFREEAKRLDKAGDKVGARLYEKAADKAEAMLEVAEEETAVQRPGQGLEGYLGIPTQGVPTTQRLPPTI